MRIDVYLPRGPFADEEDGEDRKPKRRKLERRLRSKHRRPKGRR